MKIAVQLCLNSRLPMSLVWGEEEVLLYNDPLISVLGSHHPAAFGVYLHNVFPSFQRVIERMIGLAREKGEPTFEENQQLLVQNHGRLEEAFFRLSSTPLMDDQGEIRGG